MFVSYITDFNILSTSHDVCQERDMNDEKESSAIIALTFIYNHVWVA